MSSTPTPTAALTLALLPRRRVSALALLLLSVAGCDGGSAPAAPVSNCATNRPRTFLTSPVTLSATVAGVDSVRVDFGDGTVETHAAVAGQVGISHVFARAGLMQVAFAPVGSAGGGCSVEVRVYAAPHVTGVIVEAFNAAGGPGGWDGGGPDEADLFFLLVRGAGVVLDASTDPRVTRPEGPVVVPNAAAASLPIRWNVNDFVLEPVSSSFYILLRDDDSAEDGMDDAVGQTQPLQPLAQMPSLPTELELESSNGQTRVRLLLDWLVE